MSADSKTPVPPRIIDATLFRDSVSQGPVEIIGSTKHGDTLLFAFETDQIVRDGDKLKTKSFVFNSREFSILRAHTKPMKIAGVWYEVRAIAAAPARR